MKIGLVVFEIYPSGLKQLINKVISISESNQEFIGIEFQREHNSVHYHSLQPDLENGSGSLILKVSPQSGLSLLREAIKKFDAVIIIGALETKEFIDNLRWDINQRVLFVPVSILNDMPGSDSTLGYDTAINSIVEGALKIQDTIKSVKYSKPRLFGVGVPGMAPDHMLNELAIATEGYYVSKNLTETQLSQLCETVQSNFSNIRTSSVLFYNEGFSLEVMKEQVLSRLKVDWKASFMDEALCMGSHPTATDRILASKLADQINLWIKYRNDSGQLFIINSEVVYQEEA